MIWKGIDMFGSTSLLVTPPSACSVLHQFVTLHMYVNESYGVAMIDRLLKKIGLFCRI